MNKERIKKLQDEIKKMHASVSSLKELYPSKKDGFTLDGRLVGDIGEVIAEELFQIKLHEKLTHHYDALTTYAPQLNVQIKTTFKESLTYNHAPDYYIGIKLYPNGEFEVVYNGPGKYIDQAYQHRKGIGKTLLSFPIKSLQKICSQIDESEKILLKDGVKDKIKMCKNEKEVESTIQGIEGEVKVS
jgi:hypothetical protein